MTKGTSAITIPVNLLQVIGHAFGSIASAETFALIGVSIQLWSNLEQATQACLALLISEYRHDMASEDDHRRLDNALFSCSGKDIRICLGAMRTIIRFSHKARLGEFDNLKDKIENALLNKKNIFAHHLISAETPDGTVHFRMVRALGIPKT